MYCVQYRTFARPGHTKGVQMAHDTGLLAMRWLDSHLLPPYEKFNTKIGQSVYALIIMWLDSDFLPPYEQFNTKIGQLVSVYTPTSCRPMRRSTPR